MKEILEYVTSYNDFPNKGIIFKDLLGILREPNIFRVLIDRMASSQKIQECDAIIAIEARGFIFGSSIAFQSGKPMVVARKPNKLPGNLLMKKYELEYETNILTIQKDSIEKYHKFNIVDNILATGGTAKWVTELLTSIGKDVTGYSVDLEIESLQRRRNPTWTIR